MIDPTRRWAEQAITNAKAVLKSYLWQARHYRQLGEPARALEAMVKAESARRYILAYKAKLAWLRSVGR